MKTILSLALIALVAQTPAYRSEIETFRKQREAEIGGPTGWAALTGLHWIATGTYTIGRGASNAIVLAAPSSPDRLGSIVLRADGATLQLASGVVATSGGKPVTTVELAPNAPSERGLVVGGMTMVLIKRGGRLGLRVWDSAGEGRKAFTGLKWLPIDPKLRIDAKFIPHTPAPRIKIQNVLNDIVEMENPGAVEWTMGGQTVRLEALLESSDATELFFMFRDATSGKETYGAGRYLYTPLPANGRVTLDFNKAMNPPCAFTNFATCPLPPAANRLTIAIRAGELDHAH